MQGSLVSVVLACMLLNPMCVIAGEAHFTRFMLYRDGSLYATVGHGNFLVYEVASRKPRWQFADPSLKGFTAPLFADTALLLLGQKESGRGVLVSLDQRNGSVRWRVEIGEVGRGSSPVLCDDTVVVADMIRGDVLALNANTGEPRWETTASEYHFFHPPAVVGSQLLYLTKKKDEDLANKLLTIDCGTGRVIHTVSIEPIGTSTQPVAFYRGKVLLVHSEVPWSYKVSLLDSDMEGVLWQTEIADVIETTVISGDKMIFGPGGVNVLDLRTGTLLIHEETESGVQPVAVDNDVIFFNNSWTELAALRIEPKKLLWKTKLPDSISSNPVLCGGFICVLLNSSSLALVDPTNGEVLDVTMLPKGKTP